MTQQKRPPDMEGPCQAPQQCSKDKNSPPIPSN